MEGAEGYCGKLEVVGLCLQLRRFAPHPMRSDSAGYTC